MIRQDTRQNISQNNMFNSCEELLSAYSTYWIYNRRRRRPKLLTAEEKKTTRQMSHIFSSNHHNGCGFSFKPLLEPLVVFVLNVYPTWGEHKQKECVHYTQRRDWMKPSHVYFSIEQVIKKFTPASFFSC